MNLDFLSEPQRTAAIYNGGPLMVVASAGSGKTSMLTHRVAYLVRVMGKRPSSLFVTTYTTKAAGEMKERLVSLIGERQTEQLNIGTFHSLCRSILMRLLESSSKDVFITPKLLMGGSRFFAARSALVQNNLPAAQTKAALYWIGWWKNHGYTVDDVKKDVKGPEKDYVKHYEFYQQYLLEQDKIDFDDMLFRCWLELRKPKNQKIAEKIRAKISYILVDEAQDLNRIQFLLIQELAGANRNITLVGDDFQQIFGFRGAKLKHLFEFQDWLQPHIIKLEQNYRSTKIIVDLGNKLITHNQNQIKKTLFTENEEGITPSLEVSFNADEEAEKIFLQIEKLISYGGYSLNDCVIIYRTNAQSRAIVDVLIRNQIPHKVHSNYGFYDRPEVKDIVTYVRVVQNPFAADLDDFKRIINKPTRFLGKKFIDEVEEYQSDNGIDTFWEGVLQYVNSDSCSKHSASHAHKFVEAISAMFTWYTEQRPNTAELINHIITETGYEEWMKKEDTEDENEPDNDRKFNLDALLAGASRFPFVDDFLLFIDSMHKEYEDEDDVLHLMTIHASKGKEFPVVFVIGFCDKLLPHYKCDDLEEERRCAYVAITRAKDQLFLSLIHGKYNRLNVTKSRFLDEMGIKVPPLEFALHSNGVETRSIGVFKNPLDVN